MPRLAVAPFATWTYEDAHREMQAALDRAAYDVRKAYAVDGDHFQRGTQWVGPGDAAASGAIQKQFAPEDATGEVLSNVSNAFAEPQVGIAPLQEIGRGQAISPAVQARMDEAAALLTNWWDNRRLQELIQERQHTAAWAGRAGLRLWIPWRYLENTTSGIAVRSTDDIEEALEFIHVAAPLPEAAMLLVDPSTQDTIAVFLDEEVVYNGTEKSTYKRAELVYLDPNRENDKDAATIMRVVYADPKRSGMSAQFNIGGQLLFAEMRAASLLTDAVLRTQQQLNFLTTLITRIAETAAFRERYTKNAKPQGYRIPYTEGEEIADGAFLERDEEGRQWQVIPQARTLGANTTTELIGLPLYDDRGDAKGNQMPDVVIVDPVDPRPYNDAADAVRRRILRMCAQGHLGGISNAEASGIAYEQARAVFEKDLDRRRVAEEGMLRKLLTSVLALAELIAGRPGYFTQTVRVTVDQRINAGPRSPDLVRLDLESHEANVLSQETTMARLGVEDVLAEQQRIRQEAPHILKSVAQITSLAQTFTVDSLLDVLRLSGVPDNVLSTLEARVEGPDPL